MKRKMVWLGIPWLIGLYFAATCQISVTTSLLLAAFLLLGAFRLYRRITTAQMLTAGLSAAAAVGAVLLYTTMVYQPLLAHAGTITTFSGRVTTVTTYDNDRASYQLKGQFRDGKKAKILVYTDDVDAQYGDRWMLQEHFPFRRTATSGIQAATIRQRASFYRQTPRTTFPAHIPKTES